MKASVLIVSCGDEERKYLISKIESIKSQLGILQIFSTESGEKAISIVEKYHPDIAVVYDDLADMKGDMLIKRIKNRNRKTACILLDKRNFFMLFSSRNVADRTEREREKEERVKEKLRAKEMEMIDMISDYMIIAAENKVIDGIDHFKETVHIWKGKIAEHESCIIDMVVSKFEERYKIRLEVTDFVNISSQLYYVYQSLIEEIMCLEPKKKENKHFLYYQRVIQYIKNNYSRPISLFDVANHLKLSSAYLSTIISKYGDVTLTEMINKYRVEYAKKLISEGKLFKEVSSLSGFGSQSYFSKIFRKTAGYSPSEFKNKLEIF